jgi:hypothetical protein
MYPNTNIGLGQIAAQQQRPAILGENAMSPQELPEVARELELLNSQLIHLEGLVGSLCRRLQPVTMAVPTTASNEASQKERECYSNVGQTIALARGNLRQQIVSLTGLLEALAV